MLSFNEYIDIEYCELILRRLERERWQIVKKGKLSASDDRRLMEIEGELEYWDDLLETLDSTEENEYDEEMFEYEMPSTFAF
jgi:hypothetical protein